MSTALYHDMQKMKYVLIVHMNKNINKERSKALKFFNLCIYISDFTLLNICFLSTRM